MRDQRAEPDCLWPVVRGLGKRAAPRVVPQADDSVHVPVRSGRTDAQVMAGLLDGAVGCMGRV